MGAADMIAADFVSPSDFIPLIDRFIDGTSTPEEAEQLKELLLARSDVRVEYFIRLDLHATILANQSPVSSEHDLLEFRQFPSAVQSGYSHRRPVMAAAVVAMILFCGMLVYWFNLPPKVAVITQIDEDVQFVGESFAVNRELKAGQEVKLERGNLAVRSTSGAEVIIQGPSVFRLLTDNSLSIDYGQLNAYVGTDKAFGFTVETPAALLKDYGTRFVLNVNRDGKTQADISSGEVTLASRAKKGWFVPQRLVANQSMIAERGQELRKIPYQIPKSHFPTHWTAHQKQSALEMLDQAIVSDQAYVYWRANMDDQNSFYSLTGDQIRLRVKELSERYPKINDAPGSLDTDTRKKLLSSSSRTYLQSGQKLDSLLEGDFTIELLASTPTTNQQQSIIHMHALNGNLNTNIGLEFTDWEYNPPRLTSNFALRWYLRIPAADNGGIELRPNIPIKANQIYPITIVQRNGFSYIYINGKLVDQSENRVLPDSANSNFVLGMHVLGERNPVREFMGNLYYLALYKNALSEEAVRSHAQLALSAFQE
ncbi:LamG-like jellyroll fold domain-containing protein [Gimesia algae]|uniref:FecR protein n=1 Tax=Gimesia algae TaxID=2527971 RepID=A0A517VF78_9PLAN|nr:LamG-like jellyroll fold domain-containing protein [Gimesia algae]QDT91617.1 FecR protein [Gimesia algae]